MEAHSNKSHAEPDHVEQTKAVGAEHQNEARTSSSLPSEPTVDMKERYADEKGFNGEVERTLWTATRIIALLSLCVVYVGSQVILYFVSSGLLPISRSLNTPYGNWMLTANTLAVAAICPFVGYITDMLGRRWMCLFGSLCLIIASIVQATANTLGQAVAAQAVGGIGAGICELTALAGYEHSDTI